jgi:ABC-2 type transport system permease protein
MAPASYYVSRLDLEQPLHPISGAFEVSLQAQQEMVARYRFLSPSVVPHEAVLDLAGSGRRRHRSFIAQVRSFLESWRKFMVPKIFRG